MDQKRSYLLWAVPILVVLAVILGVLPSTESASTPATAAPAPLTSEELTCPGDNVLSVSGTWTGPDKLPSVAQPPEVILEQFQQQTGMVVQDYQVSATEIALSRQQVQGEVRYVLRKGDSVIAVISAVPNSPLTWVMAGFTTCSDFVK